MATFTKDQAVSIGGKVWEKGAIVRVYLNEAGFMKLADLAGLTSEITKFVGTGKSGSGNHPAIAYINKNKLWLNVESGKLESDKATVSAFLKEYINN